MDKFLTIRLVNLNHYKLKYQLIYQKLHQERNKIVWLFIVARHAFSQYMIPKQQTNIKREYYYWFAVKHIMM